MAISVTTQFLTSEITSHSALSGGEISGSTGAFDTLVDVLMKDKHRNSNVSRQKITATIKYDGFLKMFQMFTDSKQSNKKFILVGYRMDILNDQYDIELLEYDNETVVNLV